MVTVYFGHTGNTRFYEKAKIDNIIIFWTMQNNKEVLHSSVIGKKGIHKFIELCANERSQLVMGIIDMYTVNWTQKLAKENYCHLDIK